MLNYWENVDRYRAGHMPRNTIPKRRKSGSATEYLKLVTTGAAAFHLVLVTTRRTYHLQAYGRSDFTVWYEGLSLAVENSMPRGLVDGPGRGDPGNKLLKDSDGDGSLQHLRRGGAHGERHRHQFLERHRAQGVDLPRPHDGDGRFLFSATSTSTRTSSGKPPARPRPSS